MVKPSLSYRVEGMTVVIVVRGTPTQVERHAAYEAIAHDPGVPQHALVLVDGTEADAVGSVSDLEARAHSWMHLLGPRVGSICAVVVPEALRGDAQLFQATTGEMGLRVELFASVPAAREWLSRFARP